MIHFRYVALPTKLLNDPQIGANALRVFAFLLNWSSRGHYEVALNLSGLVAKLGCTEPEALATIDQLKDAGYLVVTNTRQSRFGETILDAKLTIEDDRTEKMRAWAASREQQSAVQS